LSFLVKPTVINFYNPKNYGRHVFEWKVTEEDNKLLKLLIATNNDEKKNINLSHTPGED
jgi:hypothetical protein